jgi:predicted transcriptional regulator
MALINLKNIEHFSEKKNQKPVKTRPIKALEITINTDDIMQKI